MPVWLRNLQSQVSFNAPLLKLQCELLLHLLRGSRYDVSVVCLDTAGIRNLNRVYRNVDRATDVLAFPYHENVSPGVLPTVERDCDYNLGDVILGVPVIREESEGVRLEHCLPIMVTHGYCHLLGYRHNTQAQHQVMFRKEEALLTAFNNTFGTHLHPLTPPPSPPHTSHSHTLTLHTLTPSHFTPPPSSDNVT